MEYGIAGPLRWLLASAVKFQSRSLPRLANHMSGLVVSGDSSEPPASSTSTFTSGFSARRHATTDPDEPDPHTMKSYCALISAPSRC